MCAYSHELESIWHRQAVFEELEPRILFEGSSDSLTSLDSVFSQSEAQDADCVEVSPPGCSSAVNDSDVLLHSPSMESWFEYEENRTWVYHETECDDHGNGYSWSLTSDGQWFYSAQEQWGDANGFSYTCDSQGQWTYMAIDWDATGNGYAYYSNSDGWWVYSAESHDGSGTGFSYFSDSHNCWNYSWQEAFSNGDRWAFFQDSGGWWNYSYEELVGNSYETEFGTPLHLYYYDQSMYWLHAGDHWYYSQEFSHSISDWVVYADGEVSLCIGSTLPGYSLEEFDAEKGEWQTVPVLSLYFTDRQYAQTGFHLSTEFDHRLYDGIGWDNEPVRVSSDPEYSAEGNELQNVTFTVTGEWTGDSLMTYCIEHPSDNWNVEGSLNVLFLFSNDSRFSYLQDYIGPDWRVVYYDARDWSLDSLVYETHLLSFAEQDRSIDNLALVQHGNKDFLTVGTTVLSHQNVANYAEELEQLGESVTPLDGDIQFWHCSVAGNVGGRDLIRHIGEYTGVFAWASTDDTAIVPVGYTGTGDYTLEFGYAAGVEYGLFSTSTDFRFQAITPWDETRLSPAFRDL